MVTGYVIYAQLFNKRNNLKIGKGSVIMYIFKMLIVSVSLDNSMDSPSKYLVTKYLLQ